MKKFKKILILGSGALKIGEAGEFDYSGSQAIKALKEDGIKTVLVNPNIATYQTSLSLADTVYFLPVNFDFVKKIIIKEKPDGILLSFGGQTALNCGLELETKQILKKYNVEVLGSPVSTIRITEDRRLFSEYLSKLDIKTPASKAATTVKDALSIAEDLGYPVMVRSGYSLGGLGSGIANNLKELKKISEKALSFAPQILIEKYLHHYKEIEYEIVRDRLDNCVAVCNMENFDPLGIHTGESIVVAPSQTLNNYEYHSLRSIAIRLVRSLEIVGECNVQFALNPNPAKKNKLDYYVIELNPRLSRSSALASKATGYPLAYVAAKLALGYNLTELTNKVTKATQFCFEPALDYITVKFPRWDINKFQRADKTIGSAMKSVGEVMAIGRTFEEALQKSIRMLDLEFEGVFNETMLKIDLTEDQILSSLKKPTPDRIFMISKAFYNEIDIDKIYKATGIDYWFLYRIKKIIDSEKKLRKLFKKNFDKPITKYLDKEVLLDLKQLGFSDKRIGMITQTTGLDVRSHRKKLNIVPSVLQVDTLAGEFKAKTNYLYTTYNASHYDVLPTKKKGVIVLGGGPYRIGSSVEFDWCTVNTVLNLKKYNKESIVINCNPETVSTDYDISDKLYFEELTFERIADICDYENPYGIIISVGGQTPNNRSGSLKNYGVKILGTDPKFIDKAENRNEFSALLDKLNIDQPQWATFTDYKSLQDFCTKVGFPVLIRPSYVLSGANMRILHNQKELSDTIENATLISSDYPITVSKFIENAKEIELDAVAHKGRVLNSTIGEHIENAGVHSGDASICLPPQKIYSSTQDQIKIISENLAKALNITGMFNIQFLAKDNKVSVIEINLRASRTVPFISKTTGIDYIGLATGAMFNKVPDKIKSDQVEAVAVKVAQFSFSRISGADPILQVEMASTGEVACFGKSVEEAFLKGEIAVGAKIPLTGIFISLGGDNNKLNFNSCFDYIKKLNIPIYSTKNTAKFLNQNGIKAKPVHKVHENKSPNILDYFRERKVNCAINITDMGIKREIDDDYVIRRGAIDYNVFLYTDLKKAELFLKANSMYTLDDLEIKSWSEYRSK